MVTTQGRGRLQDGCAGEASYLIVQPTPRRSTILPTNRALASAGVGAALTIRITARHGRDGHLGGARYAERTGRLRNSGAGCEDVVH